MPRMTICRDRRLVSDAMLKDLIRALQPTAARMLTCAGGGGLKPEDIMVEVHESSPFDTCTKAFSVRVHAWNYPPRVERKESIRRKLGEVVRRILPDGVSWYVWLVLEEMAYGSDSMGD